MKNNKTILQIVPALNTGGVERGVIEISKYISASVTLALSTTSASQNFEIVKK